LDDLPRPLRPSGRTFPTGANAKSQRHGIKPSAEIEDRHSATPAGILPTWKSGPPHSSQWFSLLQPLPTRSQAPCPVSDAPRHKRPGCASRPKRERGNPGAVTPRLRQAGYWDEEATTNGVTRPLRILGTKPRRSLGFGICPSRADQGRAGCRGKAYPTCPATSPPQDSLIWCCGTRPNPLSKALWATRINSLFRSREFDAGIL